MVNFQIEFVSWQSHRDELLSVRREVFVVEQKVPAEEEIDGLDPSATHLLAADLNGLSIGTARVLPDGHIGRVAVLKEWRHYGVGQALTEAAIEYLKSQHFKEAKLNSQIQVVEFYKKLGFETHGEIFFDCKIPHVAMSKRLF